MILNCEALIHLFLFMYKNTTKENINPLMASYVAVKIHFKAQSLKFFSKKVDYCQVCVSPVLDLRFWKEFIFRLHEALNQHTYAWESNALTSWATWTCEW
jgi:hypothetical protein